MLRQLRRPARRVELFCGFGRLALHMETAESIDGLRRQADVAHHRNFGFDEARNQFEAALAAFHFHGFRAAFFDEADGVVEGFGNRNVEAAERHVRDEQGAFGSAANGARGAGFR